MRSSFRARLRCGVFLALLLGVLQVEAQDYEAQFVKGVTAMDRGSWNEAISYFRAAISARSRESTDLVQIYGMRTRPYLPHYYLGVAYANSSNCDAALEQFAESEQQGAVQKAGEYKNLQRLREKCLGSLANAATPRPNEPAPRPTAVAVIAASPTPVVVVALPTQIPMPRPTGNAVVQRATPGPGPLRRDINTGIENARQLVAEANRNRPLPAGAARAKANVESVLRDSQKVDSATPLEQKAFNDRLKIATLRLNTALKATPPPQVATPLPQVAAATVPLPLLEGASAYFEGDYARAARTLESIPDFSDAHAVAEARLIRSAARYAMYVIGGERDKRLQQQALEDAGDCRRLDPRVTPKRKVFSPRFIEFFNSAKLQPKSTT